MDNLLKIEEQNVYIKNEPSDLNSSYINDGKQSFADERVCCGEIYVINSENYWIICRICNMKFVAMPNFIEHTVKLHVDNPITIPSCEIEIHTNRNNILPLKYEIDDFKEIENEDSTDDNNEDDTDNKSFCNENILIVDSKIETDDKSETNTIKTPKNQCNLCKKTFDRPCKLKRHMSVHEKKLQQKLWKCSICNDIFTKKNLYRNHRETYHKERIKCEFCDKTFVNKSNLKEHINMHKNERPFQCDQCPMNYYSKASLTCHIRRVHLKDAPHKCPHCGKKFLRSCALTIHIRIHTGEKPYICELCGANYQTSSLLANHIKRHNNDRRYTCDICGKKFFNNTYLRDHKISVHTEEKPFGCDMCEAKFSGKPALRKHKKLHSDVKQYVCTICGKAYAQSPGLYAHMKSHQIASEKALLQEFK